MTDRKQKRPHRWGHATLIILATVLVAGIAMLWAWNTLAVDLFQAPAIGFKHVLAFQFAIAALTALPLVVLGQFRRVARVSTPC